jgi:hypothetical protein
LMGTAEPLTPGTCSANCAINSLVIVDGGCDIGYEGCVQLKQVCCCWQTWQKAES